MVVIAHLRAANIWIRYNTLASTEITAVGWLLRVNPDAYPRQDLKDHMVAQLNNEFSAFQLNARTVSYHTNSELKTRAWVVEMDKADAKKWFPIMLKTFPICNAIGSSIQLVPFSAAAYSQENTKKVFYLHNKSLADSALIRVDNLRNLQVPLLSKSGSDDVPLSNALLALKSSVTNKQLFFSVSQYNSGRVTLLLQKDHFSEACHVIDNLLDEYLPALSERSLKEITFPNKPPIRIGRTVPPAHIAIVNEAIKDLDVNFDLDDQSVVSEYTSPPTRYNRVTDKTTYAAAVHGTNTTTTQASTHARTTTSELTQEKTSRIDQLLAEVTVKNQEMEQAQHSLHAKVSQLETQLQKTLEEMSTITTSLKTQQTTLDRLFATMSTIQEQMLKTQATILTTSSSTPSPLRKNPRTNPPSPTLYDSDEPLYDVVDEHPPPPTPTSQCE